MKNRIIGLCAMLCICLSLTNCGDWVGYFDILFRNSSEDTVMVIASIKRDGKKIYTSTEFPLSDYDIRTITPIIGESWDICFRSWSRNVIRSRSDSVAIFVISPQVYKEHSWAEIGEKELFLAKYVFDVNHIPNPIIYPHDYSEY